eukprot:TRINITY_DN10921_c0_g1_i1.p1 TRINITY_DN10921_c0_g1~~TRINITY_DN10921_c0_g1_i1.p1  ORF type:complete len:404 (-),score=21.10 TRINITY_DN10921_c0_g1_i1:80-1258(-)
MASCMAAAASNSRCGVGTAPAARIAGIKILGRPISDSGEAKGLGYKCIGPAGMTNDIYSCSWGPPDDANRLEGPGTLARLQMDECIKNGRQGKGTIYVWAGGNGRVRGDNLNYDGYANSRYTIPIGSMDYSSEVSYYSESGAALMACTPGSGRVHRMTTCALGTACSSSFGGTSASSPAAAGVVALILNANPNLGWRDVQHIIARSSSTRLGFRNPTDYQTNGAGFRYRHRFGFGLMDAFAAVKLAEEWVNVPESPPMDVASSLGSGAGVPNNAEGLKLTMQVGGDISQLEHIEVHIRATTNAGRGSLEISLISPSGTRSRLQERHNDNQQSINWSYMTVANWGESSQGTWTLQVVNGAARGSAVVQAWTMRMYGFNSANPASAWSHRNTMQ